MRTRTTDYSSLPVVARPIEVAIPMMSHKTNPFSGTIDLDTPTGVKLYNTAVAGPSNKAHLFDYSQ